MTNQPIQFHRFGFSIADDKLVRKIRDLHARYCVLITRKRRDDPKGEYELLNLSRFTLRLITRGIDAEKYQIDSNERPTGPIVRIDAPVTLKQKGARIG